ncbi:teicoplanin resistance protein VanZ [Staphylococcus agnetis]|uniref:TcaA second domain-containing protein n=1 Tax=Staphylococcus agnetis TaxID=985762 RepID=UPI000D1BCB1F|nr:teicoplanin resistance protein VanZ [Staphylococcus agnetis]PTH32032.1 teicoplanin resistance protein VanZ [Staphylococcus agnetis]PTH69059.1 teicoplanin resistance protein VanZ [Staphylococcus agnetis]PTH76151.1 teicoplanin resistance protein VanZ [Staphylococcus agnetis]
MKQCPHCNHHQLGEDMRCTYCYHQVSFSKQSLKHTSPKLKTREEAEQSAKQIKMRQMIPIAIVGFILILLIILFLLLRNYNSPEAQAELLVNAIDNDDASRVSTLLSSKANKVGRKEAATYIQFIKKEIGMRQFEKNVYHTVHQLDKNSTVAKYIKTKDHVDVLRISKNGRRYLIFDNLSFQAPTKQAEVKANLDATYHFEADGRPKNVLAKKGQTVSLGNYIPGDYVIPARKETDRGTFDGKLRFNSKSSQNEVMKVTEDFETAQVDINLKNTAGLNQEKTVIINGERLPYTSEQGFGPFPVNKDLTIQAEGKSHGKTFKTEEKVIKKNDLKTVNAVTLSFDESEIEEHNKDQEDNILNKIDDFFKSYTGTLDEVNDSHSPKGLSKFVLEDSPFYDNLVSDIKNHRISSIKSSNIMNVSRNGQFYSVIVQNEDNKGRNEQGHYLLKGNDDAEQLKIVNYERYQ